MPTLDPEGLEKAAEALHNEKYPAWLWGTNEELQQHYRGQVSAAVTAYLGHVQPVVDEYEMAKAIRASLMAGMMPDDWERISQSEQNRYMDAAKAAIATVLQWGTP